MRIFKFAAISLVLISLALVKPAYPVPLTLALGVDRENGIYEVGESVTFSGSLNNGTAVPDALVLFEVDTPKHNPWIVRTFTTGQIPAGPWAVELLNVTPCSDAYGTPHYSFRPGQDAGFKVDLINNGLTPHSVVVAINLFFSNGLPFVLMTMVNATVQPGQSWSAVTWPVTIPADSVAGQAMVCASIFDDYPKNNGFPYSPEKSALFNITSGIPAQASQSSPLGTFNFSASLMSTSSLSIWLGNYTVYATTHYGYSAASAQTTFTVRFTGDLNGDGVVNMRDIAIAAKAFGTQPGDPLWNPIADITGPTPLVPDGVVNMRDIGFIAKRFGIVTIPDP